MDIITLANIMIANAGTIGMLIGAAFFIFKLKSQIAYIFDKIGIMGSEITKILEMLDKIKYIVMEVREKTEACDRKLDKVEDHYGSISNALKEHVKDNAMHDVDMKSAIAVIQDRLNQNHGQR